MQKLAAFALTTLVVSLSTHIATAAPSAPSPHPLTCTGNADGKDAVVHLTIEPRTVAGRASASELTYRIERAFEGTTYRGSAAATSNFDKNIEEPGHMRSPMFDTTLRSTVCAKANSLANSLAKSG